MKIMNTRWLALNFLEVCVILNDLTIVMSHSPVAALRL